MKSSQRTDYRKSSNTEGLNESGLRLILGQQPVREAIRVWGDKMSKVFVQSGTSPRARALAKFAKDNGIDVNELNRSELDRLAGGSTHQGVAALAPPLVFTPWSELLLRPELLAIALDGVVDPQNFGAVVRSAVGLASAPIIWAESSSAPLSPTTFRASAGAIEHATLCRTASLHGSLNEAANAGIEVIGLSPDATLPLHEVKIRGPVILVIGSEQKGMGRSVRKACTLLSRLHQSGAVQSLNASVAAGVALHSIAVTRGILNS